MPESYAAWGESQARFLELLMQAPARLHSTAVEVRWQQHSESAAILDEGPFRAIGLVVSGIRAVRGIRPGMLIRIRSEAPAHCRGRFWLPLKATSRRGTGQARGELFTSVLYPFHFAVRIGSDVISPEHPVRLTTSGPLEGFGA